VNQTLKSLNDKLKNYQSSRKYPECILCSVAETASGAVELLNRREPLI